MFWCFLTEISHILFFFKKTPTLQRIIRMPHYRILLCGINYCIDSFCCHNRLCTF